MISTSQKEHLTYSLILQCTVLAWIWILAWSYILPGIKEIETTQAATQDVITKYNSIKTNGLSFEELWTELWKTKWKEELIKIIQSAPGEARQVITKKWEGDYITWLNNSIVSSDEDKKKLQQAKQKINSILPTLSPISNSVSEDFMTLKEYIKFIESSFLKTYNIESNIVLWVQWINYGFDKAAPNIGSFDLRLDFNASNQNIQKLITYVNQSWNPEILWFSGVLAQDKIPRILSNPLMTIEALSLENSLDKTKINETNKWRVTIRFYVRGSSKEDITFLKWAINTRKDEFKKTIEKAIEECKTQDILCTKIDKLEAFLKKYNEFLRSIDGSKVETDDISVLGQISVSLQTMTDEFNAITKK